jgi:hypothetical protein
MQRWDDGFRANAHAPVDRTKRIEHDDVEAAIDFLAKRADRTAANPAPVKDATTVDFARYRARRMRGRLLCLLNGVLAAIERRDLDRVMSLLDDPEAHRSYALRMIISSASRSRPLHQAVPEWYLLHRLSDIA